MGNKANCEWPAMKQCGSHKAKEFPKAMIQIKALFPKHGFRSKHFPKAWIQIKALSQSKDSDQSSFPKKLFKSKHFP